MQQYPSTAQADPKRQARIARRQERTFKQMMCSHQWSKPYGFEGDEQQTCNKCKAHREAQ